VVPIWKKEFFSGGAVWIGDQACREGVWHESGDGTGGVATARPGAETKPGG
jgi:hypothetical protein